MKQCSSSWLVFSTAWGQSGKLKATFLQLTCALNCQRFKWRTWKQYSYSWLVLWTARGSSEKPERNILTIDLCSELPEVQVKNLKAIFLQLIFVLSSARWQSGKFKAIFQQLTSVLLTARSSSEKVESNIPAVDLCALDCQKFKWKSWKQYYNSWLMCSCHLPNDKVVNSSNLPYNWLVHSQLPEVLTSWLQASFRKIKRAGSSFWYFASW
jgi:hypothetical protein